ncbi:thioesterase family protein [Nocardia sp. alder85J]|uniref:thioesterase family protein n=1 Tax=Nocardia sp. alder85J TaxID=2862949 RepID=UPI001CD32FD5|nr:thioesterase family protein [Nocardia sp. alder85J]MCX4094421.1 thioesterase family protein [Nocardia sp. alder85J]
MPSSFSTETALVADPAVAGRFATVLSGDWNAPVYTHGGITTALAVRAMQQQFEQPLRSVHTLFVSPVPPGPVTVDVTVLRRGRSVSQAVATLRTEAGTGLVATAAFGDDRPGFEFTDLVAPEVAPPEHCRSFEEISAAKGFELAPLWQQLDGRTTRGRADREPQVPPSSEQVFWYRFRQSPRDADGVLDPAALLVIADLMAGAIGEYLGDEVARWLAPSVEMTVRLLEPVRGEWILSRIRAHRSGHGYVSLENQLWDPETGTLVAHGTQLAFYSFPDS